MVKANKIIDALKESPQTAESLPYKPSTYKLGVKNRMLFQKIHVAGHRNRRGQSPHKQFTTVYYLLGDTERAVELFVKVNYEQLSSLNFSTTNIIWSGLQKNMAKMVIVEFKRQNL